MTPTALQNIYSTLMVDLGIDTSVVFPFRSITETTADEIQYGATTVAKTLGSMSGLTTQIEQLIKIRVNFFATYTVQSDEIIGAFVADRSMTYAANFDGSVGNTGTAPAATYTFTISRNGVAIGSIVCDPSGTVSFLSLGASSGTLLKGDVVTIAGATAADSKLANFICNLVFMPVLS